MKKSKEKQTGTAIKYEHPGRPKYSPKWPTRKEFTFQDILEANGVQTDSKSKNYGKGPSCSLLTIRKGLERDMYFHKPGKPLIAANRTRVNPRSEVCLIHGVTAEPESESGLGRRAMLYCLRVNKDTVSKSAPKVKVAKPAKVAKVQGTAKRKYTRKVTSTSQTPTADKLDAIHAALSAPEPSMTVPAVKIEPAPAPAPETAPVTPPVIEAPVSVAAAPEAPAPAPEAAPVATLANS